MWAVGARVQRVKGGWAKSCLACGKAKQKCVDAVWEGGNGLNRMLMGELTGLVQELVGEMKGVREELREMKEVVEKGLKNIAKSNHPWYWTSITDVINYTEFPQDEMDQAYQELWLEDGLYWEFLKWKIDDEELDRAVDEHAQDYVLGEDDLEAGPEMWVPEVDMEE